MFLIYCCLFINFEILLSPYEGNKVDTEGLFFLTFHKLLCISHFFYWRMDIKLCVENLIHYNNYMIYNHSCNISLF
jgi:hypothetical protein